MTSAASWLMFIVGSGALAMGLVLLVSAYRMSDEAGRALASSMAALDAAMKRSRENAKMLDEMLELAKLIEQQEFGAGMRVMSRVREKRASS